MRSIKRSLLTAAGALACCATAFNSPAAARPNAALLSPAAASDSVVFSLHLPLQNVAELDGLIENQSTPQSPLYHHFLTPAQFRARYGPDPARVQAVLKALDAAGLQAAQTSTQVISVRGSASAVEQLLATRLSRLADRTSRRTRIAALAPFTLPNVLVQSGAVPFHLQKSIRLLPHAHALPPGRSPQNRYGPKGSPLGGYWADDLKQAYQFPSYKTANGSGVSVAIVDGGDFSDRDLALYLQNEGVGPLKNDLAPAPTTHHFLMPGAQPFDPASGDSLEADLDSQQVALSAPGAILTSIISTSDADADFIDAFIKIDEVNTFDIVSWSYGTCELVYTAAYTGGQDFTSTLIAYNEVFKQGNAQGITFVESSGDFGGLGCPEPNYFTNPPTSPPTVYKSVLGVEASFPNVIAVGGGDLKTSYIPGSLRSTYAGERAVVAPRPNDDPYGTGNLVALNFAAGGGISSIFPRPAYQELVKTGSTMRTVPDVGGHVGSFTLTGSYDQVVFAGQLTGLIGTSDSAPDFAGLLAIKAGVQHSRLGLENPDIYALSAHNDALGYWYFHQSNPGDDGYYKYTNTHQGYNYIYGVGSPHGANFAFLPFAPLAGDPQTSTNP